MYLKHFIGGDQTIQSLKDRLETLNTLITKVENDEKLESSDINYIDKIYIRYTDNIITL